MSTVLRSGELAAAEVSVQTLRYYERRGLLADPERTLGGHRLYPETAVRVLRVIKAAQRLGFTLDEVGDLLSVTDLQHRGRGSGLRARATAKLGEVDAKIAELLAVRETLVAALEAGCADLIECSENPGCPVPFAIDEPVAGTGGCRGC